MNRYWRFWAFINKPTLSWFQFIVSVLITQIIISFLPSGWIYD